MKNIGESNWEIVAVYCAFLSIFFIGIFYMVTAPVESSASFECEAEYIGLDLETKTIVQNESCSDYNNLTCFVQDTLKEKLNVKDLKGLKCKGQMSVKAPYLLIQNNLFG